MYHNIMGEINHLPEAAYLLGEQSALIQELRNDPEYNETEISCGESQQLEAA